MYFVHKLGYSKKIDKANEILFYWTLFGSFLVLCGLIYIYTNYNTLNYTLLQNKHFSYYESKILFIIFLLGFGIKIPLAPFHYWLLKVHVESPTAFSIFLSGFLVKSALFCLFILLSLFQDVNNFFFLTIWILISLVIATLGLGRQTDFKKLIAWATVQEMTFMLLFLIFKQIFLMHICTLFLLLHGIMSTYMFYIVDMLYRRFKTRGLVYIKGLHLLLPKLTKHFWFLILLFSGFPLTAKFLIEWGLISLMTNTSFGPLVYIILIVNFLGSILFCKIMFSIIYGVQEDKDFEFIETQKKEYSILNFLVLLILLLIWLMYSF
jgi:NADH-quinone oxidoreductase subunit M